MKLNEPDIEFAKSLSEEELITSFQNGIFRQAFDKAAQFVTNNTIRTFDKLYTQVKLTLPTWNVSSPEMIELLSEELDKRGFTDIGPDNKNFFLIHLFTNSKHTLSRAQNILPSLKRDPRFAILDTLVKGVSNPTTAEGQNNLVKYFNLFPSSDHFTANYLLACQLLESQIVDRARFYAERAFKAIPYDLRAIELLKKIYPQDPIVLEILSLFAKTKRNLNL